MNNLRIAIKNNYTIIISVVLVVLAIIVVFPSRSSALSGSEFNAGKIIDDAVFYNANSMNTTQIQVFLNSKVPSCDTNGTQMYNSTQTRAQWAAANGRPLPPYTCLKDYSQNVPTIINGGSDLCKTSVSGGVKSAAQIIYEVGQACGINPQVLIVLLQKEQSLITDTWPWPTQYQAATGYGCPDTAPCDAEFYGYFNQVYQAAKAYRRYEANPNSYNYKANRNNFIYYNPNLAGCGGSNVFIQNQATASLYIYTPYQPNAAALNNLYGTGDSCSAYGNRNFWRMFNDWFGSTYAFIRNGADFSTVFNFEYYTATYSDIASAYGSNRLAAFDHFYQHGMAEGRSGNAEFNAMSYMKRYADVRNIFSNNIQLISRHYILYGKSEGRTGTGDYLGGTTTYNGVDYSSVYSFDFYAKNSPDVWSNFGLNDFAALQHFVLHGMAEGRSGNAEFNAMSYMRKYADIRNIYGGNVQLTTRHYILYGKSEGRTGTGDYLDGTTIYNGINYAPVYSFDYYAKNNSDIVKSFGLNDYGALQHFVNFGMAEGRRANTEFNVITYRALNADLNSAFNNNLRLYYMHFIYYGKAEGRPAL